MRQVSKHIGSAVMFLAGLLILLAAVSALLVPKTNAAGGGMRDPSANGILGEPANTIDVLFLGDSESYCAFVPLQLWEEQGITSYCCGTPAQKLCYAQTFLKKCFQKQAPKLVVLETNEIFRNFSAVDSLLQGSKLPILSLFDYHDRWKSLNSRDLNPGVSYTYMDSAKGYRFSATVSKASTKGYMDPDNQIARIPTKNYLSVEAMKQFCELHNARLVLVSTPSTVNWNMKRHNAIQELSEALQLEFLDLNLMPEQVPIDWKTDSRDKGDHLNYFGANKVTNYLGFYLAETGVLKNHKYDIQYKHWDAAAKEFSETIAKASTRKIKIR